MDQEMMNNTNVNLQLQPGVPQNPNPFTLMSPTYLPKAPTSFQVWQRPYFMNQVGGGAGAAAAAASGSATNWNGGIFQFQASASNYNHPFGMNVCTNNNLQPYNPNLYPMTSSHQILPKIPIPALRKPVKIDGSDLRLGIGSRKALDHNMDPKKLKRVISNRLSAQRSRVKRLDHVSEMQRKADEYQAETGKESIFFIDGDDDPYGQGIEIDLMKKPGEYPMFGWEIGIGPLNVDLNRSGDSEQVPNQILTGPHRRNVSGIFGGIEQLLNMDPGWNPNPRNDDDMII
ncbi:hypothetical protein CCACVL1_11746 [Corchorus capsularis]|uniref:BZIP domain-containing protein n=1 Tax=Corchorus capsularis TaxID=210143 RepID=A0A1R3IJQ2_COCAP|nr:hypothetical protein CCACVL1_11746 [Corchorus capsularis]